MEIPSETIKYQQENIHGWYAKMIKGSHILNAVLVNAILVQLAMSYFNLYKFL